jgi:uncharacterized membrane protein
MLFWKGCYFNQERFMLDSLAQTLGWLHPPFTHFPIVCSILAVLAFGAGRICKQDWLLKSASALWILTFASAIPSVLLGHLFAHHLGLITQWSVLPPESALKGQLRFHALLGTLGLVVSAATLWGAIRLAQGKSGPFAIQLILGLATAVLFGAAGHEGGEMVYGSDEDTAAVATPVVTPVSAVPTPSVKHTPKKTKTSSAPQQDLMEKAKMNLGQLVKMNTKPWVSQTHGGRWVNTYVSPEAVKAYQNSDPLPVGVLVVKESFEDDGGKPSTVQGPLYVMQKGPKGSSPETHDWRYAMQWDQPVAGNPETISGPVTWLPGNASLNSCVKCHNHFHTVDEMGGVPDGVAVK